MAMIEQNISGVKLEKLRQKAVKKTKFLKKMPKVVFVVCLLLAMLKPRNIGLFLILTSGEGLDFGHDRHWNHHDFRRDFVGILHSGSGYGVLSIVVMEKNVQ